MPFTPVHMGLGMGLKAAIPRHFSIVVFSMTQVAIDLEVLWCVANGQFPLHRHCHTCAGATLIAIAMIVFGEPASQRLKRLWNVIAVRCRDADVSTEAHTSWLSSFMGATLGAYSHVLLDSLFHEDVEPFQPWSASNPFHGMMDPEHLVLVCVLMGVGGAVCFAGRKRRPRKDS